MHSNISIKILIAAIVIVFISIVVLSIALLIVPAQQPEPDPHEGQVNIYDGFDWVWITPLENVPTSTISDDDFKVEDGLPVYTGNEYQTSKGIDVSEHQRYIDWNKVRASGIDFAFIRLGYRGCTEGGLFTDPWFERNYNEAKENGIKTGIYFFSQATNVEESIDEANYVLSVLNGAELDLPIMYDWEQIEGGRAQSDELGTSTLTDCIVAFCDTVKNAGYNPGLYLNMHQGYYDYDLSRLTDYTIWLASHSQCPRFYYSFDIWQYSESALISGVDGECDVNMLFIPVQQQEQSS